MGYFSNGTEGMLYEDKYCEKCVHYHPEHNCPCLDAHMLWNYDECNKKDSILHKMIPLLEDSPGNGECIFFVQGIAKDEAIEPEYVAEAKERLGWK